MGSSGRGDPADDLPFGSHERRTRRWRQVIQEAWGPKGLVETAAGGGQTRRAGRAQQSTGAVHCAGASVRNQEPEGSSHATLSVAALACLDVGGGEGGGRLPPADWGTSKRKLKT